MSILQAIREKGAVIVIAVIAISLIGFILMDSVSSTGKMFGGSDQTVIGEVNGEPIEVYAFNEKVDQLEKQFQGAQNTNRNQIMQSAWDQMVAERIVKKEFNQLGFVFTSEEMMATMFSEDAPMQLKQAFTDPKTGMYDIQKARQWWATVKQNPKEEQRNLIIEQVIDPMQLNSLYNKYTSMIAGSIYEPSWLTKQDKQERSQFAQISYVAIPYTTISDSTIKVTDEDIESYLKEHKEVFQQEEGIRVSYVTFSAAPSPADSARVRNFLQELKPEFITDTNARFFLGRNASAISLFEGYTPKSKLQVPFKDSIIALNEGEVFGPYLDGSHYVLAKKIDTRLLPDSIKARHILLGTINPQTRQPLLPDSTAMRLADSIATAIANGADFQMLEEKYSTDEAAGQNNGEMTFDIMTIQSDNFAQEFADFLLNTTGKTKSVVKTQFGYHYIEILDKIGQEPAYKIAYMAREIIPSDSTRNAANAAAVKLAANARNTREFSEYVAKNGLSKIDVPYTLGESDYMLGSYQDARDIIKWAWGTEAGDVSQPFYLNDDYVVVTVDNHFEKGLQDAAFARATVEPIILRNKKADLIKEKLKTPSSLEAAAGVFNLRVLQTGADSTLTFNAQIINGIGNAPKIAGAAFHNEYQNKISPAIPGNTGVFLIKVNGVAAKAPLPEDQLQQIIASERNRTIQTALQRSFQALKEIAAVADYRSKFF